MLWRSWFEKESWEGSTWVFALAASPLTSFEANRDSHLSSHCQVAGQEAGENFSECSALFLMSVKSECWLVCISFWALRGGIHFQGHWGCCQNSVPCCDRAATFFPCCLLDRGHSQLPEVTRIPCQRVLSISESAGEDLCIRSLSLAIFLPRNSSLPFQHSRD